MKKTLLNCLRSFSLKLVVSFSLTRMMSHRNNAKEKQKILDSINFRHSMNRRNFYWLIRAGPEAVIPQLVVDPRFPVEVTQLDLNLEGTRWRIQGGSQGRPRGPNSFIFMEAKIIGYHTHFESWRPPPENPGSATGYY